MQHCTVCGSELPDQARYCGKCGHVLTSYTGPATYNTGHIFVVFSQQPLSPSTVWGNSGNLPAKATINSDTKSGTLEIDLSGATNTVHVSGSWSCA